MRESPHDFELSTVEDLDLEHPSKGGLTFAREFALGLLLLIGVLAWSGWEWQRQQARQDAYVVAQQAAAGSDWELARAQFLAAAGYRDSEALAKDAADKIAERDKQYRAATTAARDGRWAESLQAAEAVRSIQPRFRDIETLANDAEREVYTEALSGTVALRSQVGQAGLYYSRGGSWRWLQGSDRSSEVLGYGPPGHVIYDVPGDGAGPRSRLPRRGPSTLLPEPGSPWLSGRRLMLATPGERNIGYTPLALDPADYNYFVWGEYGVWGLRYTETAGNFGPPQRDFDLYDRYELAFQSFNSPMTATVKLPGPDWAVADLGADGRQILLAEINRAGDTPQSRLYIGTPDGTPHRFLASVQGELRSARFSPDGAHVLATIEFVRLPGEPMARGVIYLLGTRSATTTVRTLKETLFNAAGRRGEFISAGAVFVRSGLLVGKVLLAEWGGGDGVTATIVDPWGRLPDVRASFDSPAVAAMYLAEQEGDSPPMLVWQEGAGGRFLFSGGSLKAISIPANREGLPAGGRFRLRETLDSAVVRADRLVFSTREYRSDWSGDDEVVSVWSIELAEFDELEPRATPMYTGTILQGPPYSTATTWQAGAGMLAYTDRGQLRARTYDGRIDLPLERGVLEFYNWAERENVVWLR